VVARKDMKAALEAAHREFGLGLPERPSANPAPQGVAAT